MRELLRALYDRLGEVANSCSQADEDVRRLRDDVEEVLSKGYFDGCYTELDLRQMPAVLR